MDDGADCDIRKLMKNSASGIFFPIFVSLSAGWIFPGSSVAAPQLYVFFGFEGSGKTFAAKTLQEKVGLIHIEGDRWLTPKMEAARDAQEPFTQEMRDELALKLISVVRETLVSLPKTHPGIVLSYAFYREQNRTMIREAFPGVHFVHVSNPDEATFLRRIEGRAGPVDSSYVQKTRLGFEAPSCSEHIRTLLNDSGSTAESIVDQFLKLFPDIKSSLN